jgi:uncharacterized membrane protein
MRDVFRVIGKALRRNVGAGLLVFVPLALTVWLVRVVWTWLDSPIREIFRRPAPGATGVRATLAELQRSVFGNALTVLDRPGVGLIALVALIYIVGFLTRTIVGGKFVALGERILRRVPLVRSIYTGTKQILEAILSGTERHFDEVVLIEYPRKGIYAIGFVTSPARGEVQTHMNGSTMNVFLPTTPNPTSGYLLVVPREDLTTLDMSVEDAVKLVISGGIVAPEPGNSNSHGNSNAEGGSDVRVSNPSGAAAPEKDAAKRGAKAHTARKPKHGKSKHAKRKGAGDSKTPGENSSG